MCTHGTHATKVRTLPLVPINPCLKSFHFLFGLVWFRFPSPCRDSTTGVFGSKFVSVLVYGNAEGNIEVAAYQLSNQVARLIRDGVVAVAKTPQHLRVKKAKEGIIFPDVYYRDKNEYGVPQTMKADPNFPNEYAKWRILQDRERYYKIKRERYFKIERDTAQDREMLPNKPNQIKSNQPKPNQSSLS